MLYEVITEADVISIVNTPVINATWQAKRVLF